MSDPSGIWPADRGLSRGRHTQFPPAYELYLDTVYGGVVGRQRLAASVSYQLRKRKLTDILDCAAGTGFRSLDLVNASTERLRINLCDGDPTMISELARLAHRRKIEPSELTPEGADGLVVRWDGLRVIDARYDCVMCRGNALAYADTWTGRDRVAPKDTITAYLKQMTDRIVPGGHLYVDAPWDLTLDDEVHESMVGEAIIRERVIDEGNRRQWQVAFQADPDAPALWFRRYSSLLTIERVADILDDLGFEEIEPFQLPAERSNYGTIIARKPE